MSIAGSGHETTSIELTLLHGRTFPGGATCHYLSNLYRKVIAIIYVDKETRCEQDGIFRFVFYVPFLSLFFFPALPFLRKCVDNLFSLQLSGAIE